MKRRAFLSLSALAAVLPFKGAVAAPSGRALVGEKGPEIEITKRPREVTADPDLHHARDGRPPRKVLLNGRYVLDALRAHT